MCPCVTDQTREAVLHCRSGGGLAGEYFLILFSRARERDAASPDITHLRHIMSPDASFSLPRDRYKTRANLNAGLAKHGSLVSPRHRLIMGAIKEEDASSGPRGRVIRFSGV